MMLSTTQKKNLNLLKLTPHKICDCAYVYLSLIIMNPRFEIVLDITQTCCRNKIHLKNERRLPDSEIPVAIPLGLAPKYAKLTLAFLPSMIGFGSLQARSAPSLFDIVTCNNYYMCHNMRGSSRGLS